MTHSTVRHDLGQYFTTNLELKKKVYEMIINKPKIILEPSVGQGDLIDYINSQSVKGNKIEYDLFEIDESVKLLDSISNNKVIYRDFMKENIKKKYETIIGNPPYVKTQKKRNLYIDFTEKCFDLLHDGGELIFIVPSDFLKLTSSVDLLDKMMKTGSFTHIFHPHNEKMFDNASIDIIIFRYCKDKTIQKVVKYNDEVRYITNSSGLITFTENEVNVNNNTLIHEYFDVSVGLVSGKEDVYKNTDLGNIEVLNGKDMLDKYIYIKDYPSHDNNINNFLKEHKKELMERKIRKFDEKNWFEWGAPRNIESTRISLGEDCIYIYNLTRKEEVAFVGKVSYFGGGLIMLKPKKKCNLKKIASYINSPTFKTNYMFSGRFKIGHRQICNSYIPNDLFE